MVGALAGVFRNPPSEFAEGHHQRTFAVAMMRSIVDEGTYGAAELL